jgi:hypothetical protein
VPHFFYGKENKEVNVPMSSTTKSIFSRLMVRMFIFSLGIILICNSVPVCANETDKDREEGRHMVQKPIEEVLREHTNKLMSIPGVVGTAQSLCEGQPCIKVYVSKKTEKLERKIPKTLEGYPVVIKETGKFKALPVN